MIGIDKTTESARAVALRCSEPVHIREVVAQVLAGLEVRRERPHADPQALPKTVVAAASGRIRASNRMSIQPFLVTPAQAGVQ